MLHFVVRSFIRSRSSTSTSSAIRFPYTTSSSAGSLLYRDTVVCYLTRVWGLSPELATSASKRITFESTESADSVFKLLRSYGFGNSDFTKLISKQPAYIVADVEDDLRPKIEYLMSLGISERDLVAILCSNIGIHSTPLKSIAPVFDFFKEFLPSKEDLVRVIRKSSRVINGASASTISRSILPNTNSLQAHGVPFQFIVSLMVLNSGLLRLQIDSFEKLVKRVVEMGIEPEKWTFIYALNAMGGLSKLCWQRKLEFFTKLGWSDEDFVSAFRKQPKMMVCSENKLGEVMDFLVNRLGFTPSETARFPNLFLVSVKGRLVPRCSVLQVLMLSGKFKISSKTGIFSPLNVSYGRFQDKYVSAFEKDVPDVVRAYQGHLEFKGFTQVEYHS